MILELLIGLGLAAGALWFVLRPIFNPAATGNGKREPGDVDEGEYPVCPTDGPRPEPDARFCSACGRRLGSVPGSCRRCGTALETDARYCHSCGARVAA